MIHDTFVKYKMQNVLINSIKSNLIRIGCWWRFVALYPHQSQASQNTCSVNSQSQRKCVVCVTVAAKMEPFTCFSNVPMIQCMPNTMSQYITICSNQHKCEFVLSGLNGTYIYECDEIYLKIFWFVNEMYTVRLRLCVRQDGTTRGIIFCRMTP